MSTSGILIASNVTSTKNPWQLNTLEYNVIGIFHIVTGLIVFFMQTGFAFLEAGSVRSKNTTNILIKNVVDMLIGAISYWAVGYAFAFGDGNTFIGTKYFLLINLPGPGYSFWWCNYVYAATAASIVSGAVAERIKFTSYLVYSAVITSFIYPIASHWAWDPHGWLMIGVPGASYQDFSGSSLIHGVGGMCALIGALFLGPRLGRFDKNGNPKNLPGHTVPFVALGGFILAFGLITFNVSSYFRVNGSLDAPKIALIGINSILAGSGGAIVALFTKRLHPKLSNHWSLLTCINGLITGIASVCASCNSIYPWAALLIGAIAGLTFMVWSWAILKFRIDDPLDAISVHLNAGIWGMIAQSLFNFKTGLFYRHMDKTSWLQFGWNMLGLLAILTWTSATSGLMFLILKKTGYLRVSEEIEIKGLDVPIHGEPAYPRISYGSGWGIESDVEMDTSVLMLLPSDNEDNEARVVKSQN
ncbi:putative ammonium transporter 1 [Trichoplax sp. H2]|uniref:Ammonium transporter n=1 Tax=Trichoplax adhaerens TaxID=10228 RepID=B3SC87_TRIAD|nr:hypothetical protein TRIADDRAFT_61877 [Trichoplax adhaerens]EDV19694.1 hypothetical protein TRIADDRAFT_61877 [Trichoplax adhaerens]RDD38431.1 putative ammonium transporter 1 [Trichoplax sp. H2]|eukprot:XP_002117851.1 hypothetical protein TRIADDRAFT_61877 [Trichoplax adhaerens]